MTRDQIAKVNEIDQVSRAEHDASIKYLDPRCDPNVPPIIKLLNIST